MAIKTKPGDFQSQQRKELSLNIIFDEKNLSRLVFCLLSQNAKTLLQK